ncbi:MAG: LysM peptidoglycan-binding domain-containing protein [Chloroflexota bacterium]
MEIDKVKNLEKRYQILQGDYQAGRIEQTAFIAEVDKLQFQDDWGRYWMIGAQTGSWHYYDGQNWHQADPRNADNLPFMDEQGRYWQRGVKSGDWYYYQPETGEWIKPGEGDERAPASVQRQSQGYTPYLSQLQPQRVDAGPGMPGQLDGELFQDDEGRYWAIGAKTGQWYFYDHNGWHPAHEFQQRVAPPAYGPQTYPAPAFQAPYQAGPAYNTQPGPGYNAQAGPGQQPPAQSYVVQPSQVGYQQPTSPTQPIQIYITSPGQESRPAAPPSYGEGAPPPYSYQPPTAAVPPQPAPQNYATFAGQEQTAAPQPPPQPAPAAAPGPAQPAEVEAAEPVVKPARDRSESGSWYYFDGEQWLKYSTGEPAEAPPPPPKMILEQEAKPAKSRPEPKKEEPVVAEFIEDEEPPVQVVDVEVITVIEPEPKPEPRLAAEPRPEPPQAAARMPFDESRPRRATQPVSRAGDIPPRSRSEPVQPQRQPRERTPSEPRPVLPRKKEAAHEPTLIIPTGAAVSGIGPQARGGTRPVSPSPGERRRAREDTLPIEAIRGGAPAAAPDAHRGVTQAMPAVNPAARADTAPLKAAQAARQSAQQKAQAAAAQPQAEKSGFTLGDVLRSIPSTVWAVAGGLVLLLACALGLIFTWGWLQGGGELAPGGLAAIPSLTPTLDAGPPDATPTLGPTPTVAPELETTVAPVSLKAFSSADLGFSVEYPETWEQTEAEQCAGFSPSEGGLNRDNPQDTAIWICKSTGSEAAIADLLTEVLANFPADAETLNEGTISIASQTWTSAQIRYQAEDLGGQGIATLAVTNKDAAGYYLIALAPANAWNSVQPSFQAMINSFSFSTKAIAQAQSPADAEEAADKAQATPGSASTRQKTPEAAATPKSTPTPKGTATPLVYAVQSGDTLLEIALKFGVDIDLLASKNDITDPASLQVGQELVIPFTAEELEAYNAGQGGAAAAEEEGAAPAASGASGEATAVAEAPVASTAPAAPQPAPANAAPASGRIVYPAFNPGTNVFDLWLTDVATGEQSLIAAEASQPIFNRDGSLLAYRSWGLGTRGIFFRDFIGGRGGQVTRFVEDGLPTWSPDGFSFAFASRREGDRVPRIFVGNQQADEAFGIGFQGQYPSTFPDGRLVVKGCTPAGDCGIFVMGATGGGEQKISGEFGDTAPAVSPDGSKVAFMSSDRGATNWEIWVMNADGSNPQRLTQNGSNEGLPTWSPDGKNIAYVSDQGGVWAVWAMSPDGSNQRKLFSMMGSPDGMVLRDTDNSKGWLEERISWAP